MIYCFSHCKKQNTMDYLKEFNSNTDLFINHEDTCFIIASIKGKKIEVKVFDALKIECINIKLKAQNDALEPWIKYEEKCIEESIKFEFSPSYKKNMIKIKNVTDDISGVITNIFGANFGNLNNFNSLFISYPRIYEDFKIRDYQHEKNDLNQIIGAAGFPHNTISLTNQNKFLIYYGLHKCKKGQVVGVIIIKINKYNNIMGIYKIIQNCKCRNKEKSVEIYQNDILFN